MYKVKQFAELPLEIQLASSLNDLARVSRGTRRGDAGVSLVF